MKKVYLVSYCRGRYDTYEVINDSIHKTKSSAENRKRELNKFWSDISKTSHKVDKLLLEMQRNSIEISELNKERDKRAEKIKGALSIESFDLNAYNDYKVKFDAITQKFHNKIMKDLGVDKKTYEIIKKSIGVSYNGADVKSFELVE